MKTLKRALLLVTGVTALAVSMTAVQAETVTVTSSNIACADLPRILGADWPGEMQTLFQVVAATEYGAAVTGQGGDFTMSCGGKEIFPDNTMEKLTATSGEVDMSVTPVAIDVRLIGSASAQGDDIDVTVQGNTVTVIFVVDDTAATSTRAPTLYKARVTFNGKISAR